MKIKGTKIDKELGAPDFEKKLSLAFKSGLKNKKPFAIWRMPQQSDIQASFQLQDFGLYPSELESASKGFYFAPFELSNAHRAHFIRADISINSTEAEFQIDSGFKHTDKVDGFIADLAEVEHNADFDFQEHLTVENIHQKDTVQFIALVQEAIDAIRSGEYQKIVPSRNKQIPLGSDFDPAQEFFKLANAYANAFVSLVYVPGAGLWMGATPELLLSIEANKNFKTVSLAGTQSISEGFNLSQAAWHQKEIEEQALVSRYVINCFKRIRLREFEEYGPKTVKSGNLIHLKTEFTVDMEETNYPLLGTVMLDLLHPTSAVCGMPMKAAASFLRAKEGYNRAYFSGYLGPSAFNDQTALFVNLRCMRLLKNKAVLFAGAGVTEESDPESEWMETELKCKTLLDVIQ